MGAWDSKSVWLIADGVWFETKRGFCVEPAVDGFQLKRNGLQ